MRPCLLRSTGPRDRSVTGQTGRFRRRAPESHPKKRRQPHWFPSRRAFGERPDCFSAVPVHIYDDETQPPRALRPPPGTPNLMLNDIYNKRIIELAGNIPRLGRLPDPHASATAHSKLCGSTVKVDLKMEGPVVTDFAHDVKACALGQASSSIMASHEVGSTAGELRELRETVRKMLKENGSPPQGKWADIGLLEPVRDYKARHASTMLTFDAVVDAIGQIEAKAREPVSAKG